MATISSVTASASPWMLTSEVARHFGVSAETVREWTRRGELTPMRTQTGVRLFAPEIVKGFTPPSKRPGFKPGFKPGFRPGRPTVKKVCPKCGLDHDYDDRMCDSGWVSPKAKRAAYMRAYRQRQALMAERMAEQQQIAAAQASAQGDGAGV